MASPGKLTAIRSNSIPAGGVTAASGAPPTLTPADITALVSQMQPVITQFREASTPQSILLQQTAQTLGTGTQTRIASLGLGWRIVTTHTVVLSLVFSAAGSVSVDPWFPYSLLQNIAVAVNGATTVFSTDGPGSLLSYARNRRGLWVPQYQVSSAGSLPTSLVSMAVTGTDVTTTASTVFSASGIKTITASAATTATVTLTFNTFCKLAYSRDTLLGALPLQNNSVFATVTHQPVGALSSTNAYPKSAPFYAATALTSASLTSWSSQSQYDFWSVPTNAALYQDMVNNSFQILQQPGVGATGTGPLAWVYNFPQNQYPIATHLVGCDGNGAYLANGVSGPAFSRIVIQYNGGGVTPVVMYRGPTLASQLADYGADLSVLPGYYLWDGDDTSDSLTTTDEAGWLDAYSASTPQEAADVAAGTVTPLAVNVTREIVVSGAVQTVGG